MIMVGVEQRGVAHKHLLKTYIMHLHFGPYKKSSSLSNSRGKTNLVSLNQARTVYMVLFVTN